MIETATHLDEAAKDYERIETAIRFLEQTFREQPTLEEVAAAMEEVAVATGPVLLRFGQVGAFPSPRRPRVIWVGLDSGPRLRLLHDALDRRMAEFGVGREDRPFRPHVTVGRADRNAGPGEFRDFERHAREMSVDAEVQIEKIDLMESRLRPGGAEYQKLASSRLVGA